MASGRIWIAAKTTTQRGNTAIAPETLARSRHSPRQPRGLSIAQNRGAIARIKEEDVRNWRRHSIGPPAEALAFGSLLTEGYPCAWPVKTAPAAHFASAIRV